jgi:hypothetical protein
MNCFNKPDFLAVFPTFADVRNTAFDFQLKFARRIVGSYLPKDVGADATKETLYYVLAYLLSLYKTDAASAGANAGIVSSASEGSVSVSFTLPALAQSWWGKNNYGITALMMLRPYAKGGMLVKGTLPTDIVDV